MLFEFLLLITPVFTNRKRGVRINAKIVEIDDAIVVVVHARERSPIVGIAVVVRVVRRNLPKREAVGSGSVLGLIVSKSVAIGVFPLRWVKWPNISARSFVPLENRTLITRIARSITVGVKAAVAVSVRRAEVPRAIIAVDGIGVVVTPTVTVRVDVLRCKVGEKITLVRIGVNGGGATINAVIVTKPVAVSIERLLPVPLVDIAIKIRSPVVRPAILVKVFATESVNPRGPPASSQASMVSRKPSVS